MGEILSRKLRYSKYRHMKRHVPYWVVLRTNRRVRRHPHMYRHWRRTHLKV